MPLRASHVEPPIEPMLARIAEALPATGDFLFEPKWDGFRAIVFRDGKGVYIQSRDKRPFDRYFPDLHEVFLDQLPEGCVIDGEIVIAGKGGLDFDALQLRLHPAASRVAMLAQTRQPRLVRRLRPPRRRWQEPPRPQRRGGAPRSASRSARWNRRRRPDPRYHPR